MTDIGGHEEGTQAQAYLNLLLPLGTHGFVTLGPGLTWADHRHMDAFFGVSAAQSEISGLSQFQPRQGICDVYGELVSGYEISSRWSAGLDLTYAHLHGRCRQSLHPDACTDDLARFDPVQIPLRRVLGASHLRSRPCPRRP